ncbi:uncharacterized protein LOC122504054 [Leptopilina heterotoma]|uniref:uncharacterized protein LOC122504054 n=1 Tax=Leptopilina heterotoma TaxID=63436 RepID=UPI001CA7F78F|nr:uncharacterized protein LOC122504054 [Leptopilina heterotoma]
MNDPLKTNEFSEESKTSIDNNEFSDNSFNQRDNNVNMKELNNENEKQEENKVNIEEDKDNYRKSDEWMIRPCHMYKEEYGDCTGIKDRFQQYFVFGELTDCSQWKTDYQNCEKWNKKKDTQAFDELVKSETTRRMNRLKAHYANNVWKRRDKPPEDWAKPLPEWLQKRNENSYLELKSQQIKSGNYSDFETRIPWCSIL